MGSKADSIVPYGRSLSRSRSRGRHSRRSPSYGGKKIVEKRRSPSYGGKRIIEKPKTQRGIAAAAEVADKRAAKEQAAARVQLRKDMEEAAVKAVEAARKELEEAITADLEAANALQEAERKASNVDLEDRIQKLIDERQEAKKARDFVKADRLEEDLRTMGVTVNRTDFTWNGPGGLSGSIIQRRPGDWECPSCGSLCFASKDRCYKCGSTKSGEKARGGRSRERGRRSPSYDMYDDRRGGGRRVDRERERRDRGGGRRRQEPDDFSDY